MPKNNAAHHIIFSLLVSGDLILAGSSKYIYYSEDRGQTWQQSPVSNLLEVHTLVQYQGDYIAGTSGAGLFISKDGKEWIKHPQFAESDNIHSTVFVEGDLVKAVSIRGVLQESQSINEGLFNFGIKTLTYHQGKLYGGTFKQGVYRYDVPPEVPFDAPGDSRASNLLTPSEVAFSISPNPVKRGEVTLQYTLAETAKVTLQLYNANGVLLKTLVQSSHQAGNYTEILSTDHLQSGIYYISYGADNQLLTKQLMVIR